MYNSALKVPIDVVKVAIDMVIRMSVSNNGSDNEVFVEKGDEGRNVSVNG